MIGRSPPGVKTDHLCTDGLRSVQLFLDRGGLLERLLGILRSRSIPLVLVEGNAGVGKTCLLSALAHRSDGARVAWIHDLCLSPGPDEFLSSVCEQWGEEAEGGPERILHRLSERLDPRVLHLLLVDEASDLPRLEEGRRAALLSALRSLLGLRREGVRLCSAVLAGLPGTGEAISCTSPALGQRMETLVLGNLTKPEYEEYVARYLVYAGVPPSRFTDVALEEIFEQTGGNPRKVNLVLLRVLERMGPETKADLAFVREVLGQLPEGVKVLSLTSITEHQRRILRRVRMHEPRGITIPSLARELREKENVPTSRASVSGTCRLLSNLGLLVREKVGRTHRVRLTPHALNLLKEEE